MVEYEQISDYANEIENLTKVIGEKDKEISKLSKECAEVATMNYKRGYKNGYDEAMHKVTGKRPSFFSKYSDAIMIVLAVIFVLLLASEQAKAERYWKTDQFYCTSNKGIDEIKVLLNLTALKVGGAYLDRNEGDDWQVFVELPYSLVSYALVKKSQYKTFVGIGAVDLITGDFYTSDNYQINLAFNEMADALDCY